MRTFFKDMEKKNVLTLIFSLDSKLYVENSVIVRRQKYNQTLLLVNNCIIRGIQAHSGVDTSVT